MRNKDMKRGGLMSKLVKKLIKKAKNSNKTIVLPEGEVERIQDATLKILKENIANIVLLGDEKSIRKKIKDKSVTVIDNKNSEWLDEFAESFYELRKHKGMTKEKALEILKSDPLYFGAMMVKLGKADGMVAGSVNSTGNVLRPALQIIKTKKDIKTVSSVFLMGFDDTKYSKNEVLVFGDCAVNINPNEEQLADIAIESARTAQVLADIKTPRVAMLSFSTKGSAKDDSVMKVRCATEIVKERDKTLIIDGELQFDAAFVPEVQKLKAPGSPVEAKANVFIFPDLNAGNIGSKLTQRLAGAVAIGPVCQGFAKPVNDLSRGCVADDIVAVVAITVLQSLEK